MKTLLYANRAEPKSISMISILLLAAAGDISLLRKIFDLTIDQYQFEVNYIKY